MKTKIVQHTLYLNGNWHFSFVLVIFSSSWITSHFFSTLSHKMRRSCARKYDLLTIDIVEPSPDTSNGDHITIMVIWNLRKPHNLREKGLLHSSLSCRFKNYVMTLPRIHKHEPNIIPAATTVIPVLVNLFCLWSCNAGDAHNNVMMDGSMAHTAPCLGPVSVCVLNFSVDTDRPLGRWGNVILFR